MTVKKLYYCSFCGKHEKEVAVMVAATDVCICNECVSLAVQICMENLAQREKEDARSA